MQNRRSSDRTTTRWLKPPHRQKTIAHSYALSCDRASPSLCAKLLCRVPSPIELSMQHLSPFASSINSSSSLSVGWFLISHGINCCVESNWGINWDCVDLAWINSWIMEIMWFLKILMLMMLIIVGIGWLLELFVYISWISTW